MNKLLRLWKTSLGFPSSAERDASFFFPYTDNEDPVLLICSFTKSQARQLFSGLRLLIYLRQIEK